METFELVIKELESKLTGSPDKKTEKALRNLIKLFRALDEKQVPPTSLDKQLKELKNHLMMQVQHRFLNRIYREIVQYVQKEHKLVTPSYYQTMWMAIGMTVFGLPFGVVMGTALDNMAFFSLGLPIGMPIGLAIGMSLDKKAKEEGRTLNFECS